MACWRRSEGISDGSSGALVLGISSWPGRLCSAAEVYCCRSTGEEPKISSSELLLLLLLSLLLSLSIMAVVVVSSSLGVDVIVVVGDDSAADLASALPAPEYVELEGDDGMSSAYSPQKLGDVFDGNSIDIMKINFCAAPLRGS